MTIEEFVQTIVLQLPNLAVALWVIWRDSKTIEKLLTTQEGLLERLLNRDPPLAADEQKA